MTKRNPYYIPVWRDAVTRGAFTYQGRACSKCGCTERYTSSRGCIGCSRGDPLLGEERLRAHANREIAKGLGNKRYEGAPCKKCGATEKFTVNGACAKCVVQRSTAYKKATREKYSSATQLIKWVNEPPSPGTAPLYARIPALAAHSEWSVRYTDAKHLMPQGTRLFTGRDVLDRPQLLVNLANEALRGAQGEQYDIARLLMPVINDAMRLYNLSLEK